MKNKTRQLLEAEVIKYVSNIKPQMKDILQKSVLSLIGLEKKYTNDYEIDHCNSRNSVLIDAFRSIAIDEAKKLASSYKPTKEDIVNFKSAIEKEYKNQFSYAVRDIIKSRVQKDVELLVNDMKIDIEDLVAETMDK
jgi:hypothetical protein